MPTDLTGYEGRLSDHRREVLHYGSSILRQLRALRDRLNDDDMPPMPNLGSEVLADNIDWLDCFIDATERGTDAPASALQSALARNEELVKGLEPFAKVSWPSLAGADGEEGDIPDSATVEVEATDYCVTASDWYDDLDFMLTVGDFRRALALTSTGKSDG